MKKFTFITMCALIVLGCNVEDDGPDYVQVYAEVVEADLPESFEQGEIYEIDVTYLLPDACHSPQGLYASRGGEVGSARRDIYIAGVASGPASEEECSVPDGDLERESSFSIRIDENEAFTFYLWTGVDEENKNIYTQVIVPVADETPSTSGE